MTIRQKKRIQNVCWYTLLIAVAGVCMLPLYWLVRSSLMEMAQIFRMPPVWLPNPVKWTNYTESLTVLPYDRYFLTTSFITVLNLAGSLITSSFCAFGFARLKFMGKNLLFMCVLSSMMLPYAVTLIPTFIGWQRLGAYGTYLPLIVPAWSGGGAFNIFLLRQFFMTIPRDLDEATIVDGGGYPRVWWQINMPLSKSALITVGLFTFHNNRNDFMAPLIYLDNERKYTLALGLQLFKGMYNAQWHLMMAASAVVLAPALIVFLFGQRYFVEGIATSGMKL